MFKKALGLAIRLGIVAFVAVCVINSLAALQAAEEEKQKREWEAAKARKAAAKLPEDTEG